MPIRNGHAYCRVITWGQALGLDVDWSHQVPHLYIGGEPLPATVDVWIRDDHAYCPITELATAAGLACQPDTANRDVIVTRS
jgi:hypothetical protein